MNASERCRKVIESRYDGICDVYEYKKTRDEETKITNGREVLVAGGIPCHLSFSSSPAAFKSGAAVSRTQEVKVFLAPEVQIKAGSKLVIIQNGIEKSYKFSGEPAVYPSHQEINLELFSGWT